MEAQPVLKLNMSNHLLGQLDDPVHQDHEWLNV
jgi:hypothetical protein